MNTHPSHREQQALREIGATGVSRRLARRLVGLFLVGLILVGAIQLAASLMPGTSGLDQPSVFDVFRIPLNAWRGGRGADGPVDRFFRTNRAALREIDRFEDRLEDRSVVGTWLRPPVQGFLTGTLGLGTEEVLCGPSGWLFFQPAVQHLIGPGFLDRRVLARRASEGTEVHHTPQPDPRTAIFEFRDQLAARNIELIVLPIPVKASIHPERLAPAQAGAPVMRNASFGSFLADLKRGGVRVFDPAPVLRDFRNQGEIPAYLAGDTHWRPEAMDAVARSLARSIEESVELADAWPADWMDEPVTVRARGDLQTMLDLPESMKVMAEESVNILQVSNAGEALWQIDPEADILVLGDSFSNIYSVAEMGWGASAGLVERLSLHLQRPLDAVTRNDSGAYATRQFLSRELARGRDRLEGKRLVVWEFSERELSIGDWRRLPMTLGAAPERSFLSIEAGKRVVVTGTIAAMGEIPRPRNAPYADHITAVHLVDLEGAEGSTEAVVFVRTMKDYQWTDGAGLRMGQTARFRLQPWSDVAQDLDMIMRSELLDPDLMFAEPCWVEEIMK